jgi:hypothetical protein
MKKNIGRTDSIIRIIFAVVLFFFMDEQSNSVQILMAVVAGALLFTAFSGFCLLYKPFGISTRKNKEI